MPTSTNPQEVLMTAYQIRLAGCDGTTTFVMDLTPLKAAFLERVAALSREASQSGCQPVMTVQTPPGADDEDEVPF